MPRKLILHLCGGLGTWSAPYRERPDEYEVIRVDIDEWGLATDGARIGDVRRFEAITGKSRVHGILANPPCTDLAASGARWWAAKGEQALTDALSVADACMRIVLVHRPKWWALENPVGRLRRFYGDPTLIWNPCDYGDPYTKRTLCWGDFALPERRPVEPTEGSKMHLLPPSADRAALRSAMPSGFVRAFFEANR